MAEIITHFETGIATVELRSIQPQKVMLDPQPSFIHIGYGGHRLMILGLQTCRQKEPVGQSGLVRRRQLCQPCTYGDKVVGFQILIFAMCERKRYGDFRRFGLQIPQLPVFVEIIDLQSFGSLGIDCEGQCLQEVAFASIVVTDNHIDAIVEVDCELLEPEKAIDLDAGNVHWTILI